MENLAKMQFCRGTFFVAPSIYGSAPAECVTPDYSEKMMVTASLAYRGVVTIFLFVYYKLFRIFRIL